MPVYVDIAGRAYPLRFTLRGALRLLDLTGQTPMELLAPGLRNTALLLYAALCDGCPHVTLSQAAALCASAARERDALSRLLSALALALAESGRFQRVQLYVAENDDEIPQRIPMAMLDTGVTDPALVLAACPRDEQAMLTPGRALEMAMEAWQAQDWAALYPLMADAQDDPLPTLTVFETEMAELGISLLAYSVSSGTVSFDGQTATLVLDAEIRSRDGGDAQIVRESVPLRRVQDNWTMDIGTLRSLMIRD